MGKQELIHRLERALSIQALKKYLGGQQDFSVSIAEGASVEVPINLLELFYDIHDSGDEVFPNLLKAVESLPLTILMPNNTKATLQLSLETFTRRLRRTKIPCWCCGRLLWATRSGKPICLLGKRVQEPCKYCGPAICRGDREDGNCKGKGIDR